MGSEGILLIPTALSQPHGNTTQALQLWDWDIIPSPQRSVGGHRGLGTSRGVKGHPWGSGDILPIPKAFSKTHRSTIPTRAPLQLWDGIPIPTPQRGSEGTLLSRKHFPWTQLGGDPLSQPTQGALPQFPLAREVRWLLGCQGWDRGLGAGTGDRKDRARAGTY